MIPGSLEGGSCTVPTGLLPLGRLSAGEHDETGKIIQWKYGLQVHPGKKRQCNYMPQGGNKSFEHNSTKVSAVGGSHHQHFLSSSFTNKHGCAQGGGCMQQSLTHVDKKQPGRPCRAKAKSQTVSQLQGTYFNNALLPA